MKCFLPLCFQAEPTDASHSHHGVRVLSHSSCTLTTITDAPSMVTFRVFTTEYLSVSSPVRRSRLRVISRWLKHLMMSRLRCFRSWIWLKGRTQSRLENKFWFQRKTKENSQKCIGRSSGYIHRTLNDQTSVPNAQKELIVLQSPSPVLIRHAVHQLELLTIHQQNSADKRFVMIFWMQIGGSHMERTVLRIGIPQMLVDRQ